MDDKKICNQVLKGLCNCHCVENGTYPCFLEKKYLLKQQNLALKEENEKLQRIRELAMRMHKDWNEFDPINEGYIERIENKNKELEQKLKIAVEALEAISKAHSETVPRIMQYVQQALTKIGQVE